MFFRKRINVLFFCYHKSHAIGLGDVPVFLDTLGYKVTWVNQFEQQDFVVQLPENNISFVFGCGLDSIGKSDADIYISPMVVGSNVEQYLPKKAIRIHPLVTLTNLSGSYDKNFLIPYHSFICAGQHQVNELNRVFSENSWNDKLVFPTGYWKLDVELRKFSKLINQVRKLGDNKKTVVFAPTHAYYINQNFSILKTYGKAIVSVLLKSGYAVIFRPHIESWRDQDALVVEEIVKTNSTNKNFKVDKSTDYFDTYSQSDFMLTDVSGTAFTYSFIFGRPSIFFQPYSLNESFTGIQFKQCHRIGARVESLLELLDELMKISVNYDNVSHSILGYRSELLFNVGQSEKVFVTVLDNFVKQLCS